MDTRLDPQTGQVGTPDEPSGPALATPVRAACPGTTVRMLGSAQALLQCDRMPDQKVSRWWTRDLTPKHRKIGSFFLLYLYTVPDESTTSTSTSASACGMC